MIDWFSLAGKRAFITGGTSGIGRAAAEAFVAQGATVAVADITNGTAVAKEIGAHFVSVDVSNEVSVEKALQDAAGLCGGNFDTVVLNAGVGDVGPTFEKTEQAFIEKVTKINHWGVLYGLKHACTYE